MHTVNQILENLDSIEKHIRDMNFSHSELNHLKLKLSGLSSQLAVHHSLTNTERCLRESSGAKLRQSRIEKFIKVVHGGANCPSSRDDSRWVSLRALDCGTFLLIAASYTPVDVAKMHRTEFEFLIVVAPEYLNKLPSKWMFRKEFQWAVAAHAGLGGMPQFKRSMRALSVKRQIHSSTTEYHELEYSNSDEQEFPKRLHRELRLRDSLPSD